MFSHQRHFILIHGALIAAILFASVLAASSGLVRDSLLGMAAGLIPYAVFGVVIFNFSGGNGGRISPAILLVAEAIKLVLALVGFAVLFGVLGVSNPAAVFAGFLLIFVLQTISALIYYRWAFGLGRVG